MRDLTPSGKTTVETADYAICLNHNPEEVTATSALWKSATASTNDHSEQVTFKLFCLQWRLGQRQYNFASNKFS